MPAQGIMSDQSTTGTGAAGSDSSPSTVFDMPSVEQILSGFPEKPTSLPPRGEEAMFQEEQENLLRALQTAIESVQGTAEAGNGFELKELHASLEQAADTRPNQRYFEVAQNVRNVLDQLWSSNSELLTQAAETLANASRDPSWRAPFGQSGILKLSLEIIASKDQIDAGPMLHSLRLVGNSCADTDENRGIVIDGEYISAIIRHFLNPDLIHVAIPVIYNICMDYEPAHAQMAGHKMAFILLSLLKQGAMNDNSALLSFAYDLIELVSEQANGIDQSPDGTILLLQELALDESLEFEYYSALVNSLAKYLETERFREICVSRGMVEGVLSILRRSYSIDIDSSSPEETKALAQLRLKINQSLAEVSAVPLFAERYPLDSPLSQTLKSWTVANEDQLQVCACVMLGNLARSDEVCQAMVQDLKIHEDLISVLKSEARGAVLHSALGFLKNLAIAGDNRIRLAEAGIIPAVSRLWAFESVPQVQFSAATIARLVVISSMDNIARLLAPLAQISDSSAHEETYLSLLLSLFEKTDSSPIKTEIGRTVASICRTISPKARDGDEQATSLSEKLYGMHQGVARPVGAMVTQSQWPVVRSEGWFALALMATNRHGCAAVVECLQEEEVMELLKLTMSDSSAGQEKTEEKGNSQATKDRENVFVLVQELLKNESGALPASDRAMMEDWVKEHASRHLQSETN